MWMGGVDRVYQIEWWNKICWIRDYHRWHTIHIQIMMIRHRMRCVVDSLSWWIGVQSITSIYLMYSYRMNNIIIYYLIILIHTSFSLIHLSSYPSSQFSLFSSFNPLFFHHEQWNDMNHSVSMIQEWMTRLFHSLSTNTINTLVYYTTSW